MTTNFPNPFYPLLPGTGLAGTTVQRAGLVTLYPQFTGATASNFNGFSWYHSLQLKVERRFANGVTFQSSYTFSKMMEAIGYLNGWDPYPERVVSAQDFPQRFSIAPFMNSRSAGASDFSVRPKASAGNPSGWQAGCLHRSDGAGARLWQRHFLGNLKDIPLPRPAHTADQWFNVRRRVREKLLQGAVVQFPHAEFTLQLRSR
jgi:hypothetical protein